MKNSAHAKLFEKTQLVRREYNLPASSDERVVQDYRCSLNGATSGKVYITQHALYFFRSADAPSLRLPFRSVATAEAAGKTLVVESVDGTVRAVLSSFTSVAKRDEALVLVQHFSTVPYAVRERQVRSEALEGEASSLVDIESGARAAKRAEDSMYMAAATLEELARQREVVAGMRDNLYRMEDDLEDANRHLRGIESIGGALANKMTSPRQPRGKSLIGVKSTVSFRSEEEQKQDEQPVLEKAIWKKSDDSLQAAVCVMDARGLVVKDELQQQVLAKLPYEEMIGVTMRARPLHCDLTHGKGGGERIRLCSSELQAIVNELALRCKGKLQVVFEPNAIVFDYGDRALRRAETAGEYGYIKNEQIRKGFQIQDSQMDEVESAAKKLQMMGLDMGEELDESTANIQALGRHTDAVGGKISVANQRVVRLLDK